MTDSKRPFGFWTATALVVGGMVGSGIFVLPAQLAPYGWTGFFAWFAGVGGALLLALVLSRLAAAMPEEPGAVAICARALGPLPGVVIGWAYWVGVWSANAIIALTAIRYLATFWPPLASTPLALAAWSVALIWAITLLNLHGAKTAGRFQVLTTLLKLLPLVAVVVLVAGFVLAGGKQFASAPHTPFDASRLTPALTLAFFALVGFESASIAAERVRDPARNVVRATMAGLILTGALYLIVCSGIVFALPEATVAGATAPVVVFVESFWGRAAGLGIAALAVVATVGCLNGWVLLQGELPLGMARAGVLPRWVGRTSSRDVPVGALLVSSALASMLVMSNATRSTAGLLDFMLRLTTAATLWLYVGACLSALRLALVRPIALAGLAFAVWAMWGAGREAVGLSLGLMLTAVPLYYLALRGSAAEQPPEQAAVL